MGLLSALQLKGPVPTLAKSGKDGVVKAENSAVAFENFKWVEAGRQLTLLRLMPGHSETCDMDRSSSIIC